jgi:thioredoxin reductase (NADPH)
MDEKYDVVIVGSGITGLSAAMYAGRMKLKTLVIGELKGGTLIQTNEIRNWPGIKMISGSELIKQVEDHAKEYDVEIKQGRVDSINESDGGFVLESSGEKYASMAVILATGTKVKKLGVPGEDEFDGNGVHYCALCDGFFYKDKTIAVIGGSDSAAKEAVLLTQWAKKVYIIYRGDEIHPEPFNMERVRKNDKIEVINNTNVTEFLGNDSLEKVKLDNPHDGSDTLALDGVFVEIGHIPLSGLAKRLGVELNKSGEIIIDRNTKTNREGVFAAGDVVDDDFKQAIIGSAEGVIAAYNAYEYVTGKKVEVVRQQEG